MNCEFPPSRSIPRLAVFLLLLLAVPCGLNANTRDVERVHRGDLVEIEGGWVTRLAGIITPALDEPFGRDAFEYTRNAIQGKRVMLFTWTTNDQASGIVRDENGLPFAEIWYGDHFQQEINAVLLQRGLARVNPRFLPENKAQAYRALEAEARANKIGIWSVSSLSDD